MEFLQRLNWAQLRLKHQLINEHAVLFINTAPIRFGGLIGNVL